MRQPTQWLPTRSVLFPGIRHRVFRFFLPYTHILPQLFVSGKAGAAQKVYLTMSLMHLRISGMLK